MGEDSRARLLVLKLDYAHRASYYDDWIDAFDRSADFTVSSLNILGLEAPKLEQAVDQSDAVVLLHSCNADTLEFFRPLVPVLASRRRARVLTFIGNEFNSPYVSTVERNRLIREAGIDVVATQLLPEAGKHLYGSTGARIVSIPHALNPEAFRPGPRDEIRRLDIGVKGFRYPPFLGDEDRNSMIRTFAERSAEFGLMSDISEDARLGRAEWARFLGNCRGTISTEVGSWYIEPDDRLISKIKDHFEMHRTGIVIGNESAVRRAARHLPMPVKAALWRALKVGVVKFEVLDDFNVPFNELDELFFKDATRPSAYGKAISSRHFDAIGTKTCQIMLKGRFNDILEPNVHYIAVDAEFGDICEALRRFKDPDQRKLVTDAAYNHVVGAHTYAHRTETVYQTLFGP